MIQPEELRAVYQDVVKLWSETLELVPDQYIDDFVVQSVMW